MNNKKRKTKTDLLNKDKIHNYQRLIKARETAKEIDFTEKQIPYDVLKTMYKNRVEAYRKKDLECEHYRKRNLLKAGDTQFELYRELVRKILLLILAGKKVNRYKLIDDIILYNTFDKWKRDNPQTYEQLIIEELSKLSF